METTQAKSRIHPLVAGASIAVIVFSAVGVAALTGYLPGTSAQKTADQAPGAARSAPAAAPVAALSPQAPAVAPSAPARQAKPVQKPVQHVAPQRTEGVAERTQVAAAPAVAQQRAVCSDCGSVIDVREVEVKGEGSGVGAVAGGVAGAVIGNQFGRGGTKTVARIAGAAGGAYAGHQIEKQVRTHKRYDVIVRMEAGGERTVSYESAPTWRAGDRVRIVDGRLELDR
ncbi:MAG: glycine zipper 2TM domain-containing protein [Burkholderiales bacterium]